MLCICYWFHFTGDIEYDNMVLFKQTRWNEKIMGQIPFLAKKKKKIIFIKRNVFYDNILLLWFIIFVMTFFLK